MQTETNPAIVGVDVEITSMSEDRLDRKAYARRIAERIHTAGAGPSVVFGLTGPWGSGKSSVINMITEVLETEHNVKWSVTAFTPWSASNTVTLADEFYNAVASAMPSNVAGEKARTLLSAAAPTTIAVIKAAGVAFVEKHLGDGAIKDITEAAVDAAAEQAGGHSFTARSDPFTKQFETISDAISQVGKNVLVVVDDVDRLHADELLAVMKTVRLLGRFPHVHYLLSYDEKTVIDVLTRTDLAHNDHDRARDYLEKIVQYPFELPPLRKSHLITELRLQLKAIAQSHGISYFTPAQQDSDPAEMVYRIIPEEEGLTLRRIYRLCNQVDVMLSLIGGEEIDLTDATVITYLRLHHPDLYRRLPRWRSALTRTSHIYFSSSTKEPTAEEWLVRIADVVHLEADAPLVRELYRVLRGLFPALPHLTGLYVLSSEARLGVRLSAYFHRYFAFGMPEGDVSNASVQTDFSILLSSGQWAQPSIIHTAITDPDIDFQVFQKVFDQVDEIRSASVENCISAAHAIAAEWSNTERGIFSRWHKLIYLLLGRAITDTQTSEAAQEVVNAFYNEFGLNAVLEVGHSKVEENFVDHIRVHEALRSVDEALIEAVLNDLKIDRSPDERVHTSTLDYARYLDEESWMKIRQATATLLNDGSRTQSDIAARFVSVALVNNGHGTVRKLRELETELFTYVIPQEQWDLTDFPEPPDTQPDETEHTLLSCKALASKTIRSILITHPTD